ncbi:MBL fold metallo-hydrolase [Myxococcota bacterium]|nr:MBL fold metallo-hydrolase [Myxococcota bacterium]
MRRLIPLFALLSACVVTHHPLVPAELPASTITADTTEAERIALLNTPGPIVHSVHISGRSTATIGGLVDLSHPNAAGLQNGEITVVTPVHRLIHPSAGAFVVNTGFERAMTRGGRGAARGFGLAMLSIQSFEEPLADILKSAGTPLAGVLLTSVSIHNVLGLRDVPPGTPIYAGANDTEYETPFNTVLWRTVQNTLDDHDPLRTFNGVGAVSLGPIAEAYDLLGDGSLWALSTPGHTPGSMAYLARTTEGPVLFTGDTCHTIWSWEHNVTPGSFTADHAQNATSLNQLKALAELLPGVKVYVGHETDGEGTGVDAP